MASSSFAQLPTGVIDAKLESSSHGSCAQAPCKPSPAKLPSSTAAGPTRMGHLQVTPPCLRLLPDSIMLPLQAFAQF